MADTASSATKKRGRPTGTSVERAKTVKFNKEEAVIRLTHLAKSTHHPHWSWDGKTYPKTKRSNGPNRDSLEHHSPVLLELFYLARNGYPDGYILRDVLLILHDLYGILQKKRPIGGCPLRPSGPSDPRRRSVANHVQNTMMLHRGKAEIASPGLRQVVSLIQSGAPMADTAAANVATLQADAGGPPPPEADTAMVVPYLPDGTIGRCSTTSASRRWRMTTTSTAKSWS